MLVELRHSYFNGLAGGVLTLALFGAAMAEPLDDGEAAYQRGDYTAAIPILRPLAEQGVLIAQIILGFIYAYGLGVPDYAQAVVWYRKAAEQGDADAQVNLGAMYYHGQRVPQDYEQAATWYRKAAEQGNARGQASLGVMYDEGQGVLQDYVQPYMWCNLAGSHASDVGGFRDAVIDLRVKVAAKMTPEQIEEAQRMAREWKPTK
jgi:uncharacterized protein